MTVRFVQDLIWWNYSRSVSWRWWTFLDRSEVEQMSSYSLGWSVTSATFCSCRSLLLNAGGPDHPPELSLTSPKGEFLSNPLKYHPVGVSWWNSESVVLARISGAMTVLKVQDRVSGQVLSMLPEGFLWSGV